MRGPGKIISGAVVLLVAACSSGGGGGAATTQVGGQLSAPAPVSSPSSHYVPSSLPPVVCTSCGHPRRMLPHYPKGFPKIVPVATLPDQVRSWYRLSHYRRAVAVAPGVWTPLPPGAGIGDALASNTLDGFCASVKAFERKYRHGESAGGACW